MFAASSLAEAFGELSRRFEREHLGSEVVLSLAGSQELRVQVENGAPADVIATADLAPAEALARAARVHPPTSFATNALVVAVAAEARAKLRRFEDLPQAERIVIGTPEVPVGRYTELAIARTRERFGSDFGPRVLARVVSRELNVKQVLSKVTLGEADAGFVYRSDLVAHRARSKQPLSSLELPGDVQVPAEYGIAIVRTTSHEALARAFVDGCLDADGQRILEKYGFGGRSRRPR